jgi:hypothetical protein
MRQEIAIMTMNADYLSPCGLYCGVCGVLYATRDNNQKFLELLLNMYKSKVPGIDHLTTEDLLCDGCLSERRSIFCRLCTIRDCVQDKGFEGCNECNDFPCKEIKAFPVDVGKKVILRSVPYRREQGTEKWVHDEELRYHCPECNHKIFRGAKRCNECKTPVDLD